MKGERVKKKKGQVSKWQVEGEKWEEFWILIVVF
jgi:hypothetical protein